MRLTPVVKNLLILNVALFIIAQLDVALGQQSFGHGNGYLGLNHLLSLHYPGSEHFQPLQLVTHFFMHGSIMHIAFNMFALVMFGPPIEIMWGPKRFLTFYIACALGSAALHLGYTWWNLDQMYAAISSFESAPTIAGFQAFFEGVPLDRMTLSNGNMASSLADAIVSDIADGNLAQATRDGAGLMKDWVSIIQDIPMVGASGAVFGVLLAFGMKFPDTKLMLLFFPVPVKARYFIPVLMLIELFLGVQQYSWDNIAHFAHLGGALIGLILILYWRKFDPPVGNRWDKK